MQKNKPQLKNKLSPLSIALLFLSSMAHAQVVQTPPDAGAVTQQVKPSLQAPVESKFEIEFNGDATKELALGGPVVELKELKITGNRVFSDTEILASLGAIQSQSYDLAGFRKLSNQISQFYRIQGYPFARAYIPAQDMKNGVLTIQVVEGYYGAIQAEAKEADVQAVMQQYLQPLKPGMPITSADLERVVLIMNDVPGVKAVPVISPGEKTGTGNLKVLVKEERISGGEVSIDNLGSRYTGYNRMSVGYKRNRLLTLGDEFDFRGLLTDEQMMFGRVGYSAPLLPNGLRGTAAVSRTQYELAKEFAALKAVGVANQYSLGLGYPWVRSQMANVNLSATLQHKELTDDFRSTGTKLSKSSTAVPVAVSFDRRDKLLSGGLLYGSFAVTNGSMKNANDFANTTGAFTKTNLDLVRLQNLTSNVSLFFKYSGQYARKNLDSSEDFFLGGAQGVRAYPQGKASGDKGSLTTAEVRFQAGPFAPYAFYDLGRVSTYARPTDNLVQEERKLSGAGLGMRYARDNWNMDIAAAWRNAGGKPTSDLIKDPKPRLMLSLGYRF